MTYLSTTSEEDLLLLPTALFRFERPDEVKDAAALNVLAYGNRWFLSSRHGGCSCHYRYLAGCETSRPEFGPTEDWCPEDEEDVESTRAVYDVIARLVAAGQSVDVYTCWNGEEHKAVVSIPVSLARVSRESFGFFENYRFEIVP